MTELEEKIERAVNKVMESMKTELDPRQIIKDGDCIYFRGEKYQKVESPKPPEKLYNLIEEWWADVFTTSEEMEVCIDNLVNSIEEWLPKEQSAAGSQNAYVECSVEGYNDCLNEIKSKLR